MSVLQGDQSGLEGIIEYLNFVEICLKQNTVLMGFTNWLDFGFDKVDFGWGKPVWNGISGTAGSCTRDFTILQKASWSNGGIEAWITLSENEMEILGNDPEFLAFASPNPSISTP
ncbi:hypothetical protein QQP08_015241 [Theobroma cacao]|nr:hypothetical protein QQP08_015241 [Theobroma cacao]